MSDIDPREAFEDYCDTDADWPEDDHDYNSCPSADCGICLEIFNTMRDAMEELDDKESGL